MNISTASWVYDNPYIYWNYDLSSSAGILSGSNGIVYNSARYTTTAIPTDYHYKRDYKYIDTGVTWEIEPWKFTRTAWFSKKPAKPKMPTAEQLADFLAEEK